MHIFHIFEDNLAFRSRAFRLGNFLENFSQYVGSSVNTAPKDQVIVLALRGNPVYTATKYLLSYSLLLYAGLHPALKANPQGWEGRG
jgi:hypothetical protein